MSFAEGVPLKTTSFKPNRGQFIGGGLAASAATFASINVIAAPTKEIVIGLNVPTTGSYSDQGADQLRAYTLAIAEINAAGGVMGMKLKTSVGDDQTKAPVAVENARRMIERDGAIMITGGSSTGTAVAVSGLCQEKKTIFMATLTHGDETTDGSCHYHTFRRYNNAHMSARSMAQTLLTRYGTGRWFHITADYVWGHSVYDNLIEVLEPKGAKTVKNILLPLGTTDFSSALSQAQAAKPDVLVITEFGKDMVNALNQAAQFGLTKSAKILVPLADEYMAKGTGDNFDNVVTTAPWYWKYHAAKYPAAKKFVQAFIKKYGVPPSNGAENAYTDIYQWKSGIERSGSLDPAKFIAKMEGHRFTATKEPEYWRAWDHQGINSCLVMEGVPIAQRGSEYPAFAFAKVLEVHSGDSVAIPQSTSKCKIETA
jgi:branched-chain amino acid transport system substrate-binding protein